MQTPLIRQVIKSVSFVLTSLGIVLGVCMPADAHNQCASWTLENRTLSEEINLICLLQFSQSGRLKSVNLATIYSEISYYYELTAASGNKAAADIIVLLVNERERRTPPKGPRSATAYSAFLSSGQIDKAEAERIAKDLDLPAIDFDGIRNSTLSKSSEATYWSFDDSSRLVKGAIDLSQGAHIVVYAAPGCGICAAASLELTQDVVLNNVFSQYSVWVDIPDANFGREYFRSWSKSSPAFPIRAIFDRHNWPQRELAATPYFFVVKDGRITAKILGWTSESKQKMREALRQIGLLGPNGARQ